MARKKFFLTLLLTIIFYNFVYSDFSYKATKISIVLSESDVVFVGKVNKVEATSSTYISYIEVVEMLKGSTGDKNIILNSKLINGAYTGDEAYPYKGNTYIFFCRKGGEGYMFTTTHIGKLSAILIELPHLPESFARKDDITLLLNAYNRNKELFSKAGKQELFNLYPQLKSEDIQFRVLADIEDLADKYDTEFFAKGLKSDNDIQYHLFSIRKVSLLKIEQFKETIVSLLLTTPNTDINFTKISRLLGSLRDYVDIKFKDIFLEYINSEREDYRYISYQAIGRLGDEATILALVPYYAKEKDATYRSAIITALENIKNNDVLIPVLLELKKIESEEFMIQRIDEIIAKRTRG